MGGMSLVLIAAVALAPKYDLVIRNGRIIDGTGHPAYFADVAVKRGKIVAIARGVEPGRRELDAKGMVVAPGFIDVHSHAENVVSVPDAPNYIRMGVTTLVVGNCGGSSPDIAEFFAKVDRKVAVNVASLIGHNTVRSAAMGGSFDRPPTPEEMAKMKAAVEKAMRDGACGLSTGLIYLPGTFAKTDEIVELAKVAAKYDGIYATHMRNEADKLLEALQEAFDIGRGADIRVQISHLKVGKAGWGLGPKALEAINSARAEGLDVTQDQYLYTASSTSMSQTIPAWAREGGREAFRQRLADPTQRERMEREMKENLARRNDADYGYAVIARCAHDKALNGLTIPKATKLRKGTDDLESQIDFLLELEAAGGAGGVFFGMQEEDLVRFLSHPNTMVAADGSARLIDDSVPHPRSYGNNARVLGRYVREQRVLPLEEAVRRMTSLPAITFRLRDRGQIRAGYFADLVVFDPATVIDPSTYDQPHQYAVGFRHVVVNGTPVVADDKATGARPGRALRHRPDAR